MPDLTLGDLVAGGIDDTDLMPPQGASTCHETQGCGVILIGTDRPTSAGEGLAPDAIDLRPLARGWKGCSQRRFGQAVDRRHRLGSKTVLAKALAEACDRFRADGLGTVQGHLPGAEVQPFDVTRL